MTATNRTRILRLAADPTVAVQDLGLACCALEVEAAIHAGLLRPPADDEPATRMVLLVSGTVTKALGPAISRAIEAGPVDVRVISIGACANTGGPYWDAESVVSGVDTLVTVHAYVPGCPPRPEALVAAIQSQTRGS